MRYRYKSGICGTSAVAVSSGGGPVGQRSSKYIVPLQYQRRTSGVPVWNQRIAYGASVPLQRQCTDSIILSIVPVQYWCSTLLVPAPYQLSTSALQVSCPFGSTGVVRRMRPVQHQCITIIVVRMARAQYQPSSSAVPLHDKCATGASAAPVQHMYGTSIVGVRCQ